MLPNTIEDNVPYLLLSFYKRSMLPNYSGNEVPYLALARRLEWVHGITTVACQEQKNGVRLETWPATFRSHRARFFRREFQATVAQVRKWVC